MNEKLYVLSHQVLRQYFGLFDLMSTLISDQTQLMII